MIYILACIYAHVHGQTNAFLYARKGAEALPDNEHRWLVIERALFYLCAFLGLAYGLFLATATWAAFCVVLGEAIAGAMAFSYWHNRAYYLMRDRIDGTTHGAKYTSPTSTAKNTFTYKQRGWWCVASIPVLICNHAALWLITRYL